MILCLDDGVSTSPSPDSPRPYRGRLVVLAAIGLTALNLRTAVTGYTAIADVVEHELGFGSTITGLVGTIVTACFAVCAFLVPALARRIGLERGALLAVVVTTVGLALRAGSGSTPVLLASTAVAFAGVGMSNVLLIPVVKKHFGDRVKTLSTGYMLLLQVGQFAAPIIAVAVSRSLGWRAASSIWPVLTAIASVLWVAHLLRGRPGRPVDRSTPPTPDPTTAHRLDWHSPLVWGLIGLMGMTTLHTYVLVTWLPSMFSEAGLTDLRSASLLSVFAAMGLGAALVVPALVGSMRNPFPIVVVSALLLLAGYVGMWSAPRPAAVVWAALLGLGVSTFPLCLTLIGTRTRTPTEASSLSGVVQGVGYGIGCLGPLLLGVLHDATTSWHAAYALLMCTLVITLTTGWYACKPGARATRLPSRSGPVAAASDGTA